MKWFLMLCVYVLMSFSDFLKECFFGLLNFQGNYGESVKEVYFYLDNIFVSFGLVILIIIYNY